MTRLAEWQAGLACAIDALAPDNACLGSAVDVPGLSAGQGCSVYRNSSRSARTMALEDTFAVCRRLVGEECFAAFAAGFIECSPSQHADLNQFGAGFAEHVAETVARQSSLSAYPWLGDLVRLEWWCHAVYYRADDAPFEPGELDALDPAQATLQPAHRVAWMRSAWPVHHIWDLHRQQADPPALQIEGGDWYLVIERHNYQAEVSATEETLWRLLEACADRPSIEALACDPALAVERLGELLSRGWIRIARTAVDAV